LKLEEEGKTRNVVRHRMASLTGILAVADPTKSTTAEAVRGTPRAWIKASVMLTRRQPPHRAAVARQLGLNEVQAEIETRRKSRLCQEAARGRLNMSMAGDGNQRRARPSAKPSRHCHGHRHRRGMQSSGITPR